MMGHGRTVEVFGTRDARRDVRTRRVETSARDDGERGEIGWKRNECLEILEISRDIDERKEIISARVFVYSTVTDLARFLGWSTLCPRKTVMW